MIVVQMQDDRIERQPLVAADRAAAAHVLEAVEQAVEPRADRMRRLGIARQRVRALIGRAERARAALAREVLAERLRRPAPGALRDRVGKLDLVFAQDLMDARLRSAIAFALRR